MSDWHTVSTDGLCQALLSLRTQEECYAFLEDICTIKEVLNMAQRLTVTKMLAKGASYAEISKKTGVSTATISRISKCYEYGTGGYRLVIGRCEEEGGHAG